MYKDTITKEELSNYPKVDFEGKIIVVSTPEELEKAIHVLEKEEILGFDTETKPSFVKGVTGNQVALMQISTENQCFLFRLNKLGGLPKPLIQLLTNGNIKKIGISLKDDFHALRKRNNKFTPSGFVDLQSVVSDYGISEKSLQKIYAILFEKRISKSQRLSNWEAEELSDSQKEYAAIDAWACLKIYKELKGKKEE